MKLAEKYMKEGDILQARRTYLTIFDFIPRTAISDAQAMIDIYNATILDWHYRHGDDTIIDDSKDDFNWQEMVPYILENEKTMPSELLIVVELAKAMKAGTYDGSAQLVPRNYALAPQP